MEVREKGREWGPEIEGKKWRPKGMLMGELGMAVQSTTRKSEEKQRVRKRVGEGEKMIMVWCGIGSREVEKRQG